MERPLICHISRLIQASTSLEAQDEVRTIRQGDEGADGICCRELSATCEQ
jgi:hypothetical protein